MNEPTNQFGQGSLLEGLQIPVQPGRIPLRQRLNRAWESRVVAWRAWASATPERARNVRRGSAGAAAVLVIGLGAGAYFAFAPKPQPDYLVDPFDDVLDFTMLSDEFNNLPIDERLRLIKELVGRFKSMDGSESELVAAFAAGITGQARKQLEKNASKLVLDVLDREAVKYEKSSPEDREKAIESSFVALFKTMDALDGRETDKTDEEIVEEGKEEAERGKEWIKKQDRERLGRNTGRMVLTLNDTIAKQASAQQRGRMTLVMRDMTRHLRGEPIK